MESVNLLQYFNHLQRTLSDCFLSPNLSLFLHTRNRSFSSVQTPSTGWPDLCKFTHVPPSSQFATQSSPMCAACEARNYMQAFGNSSLRDVHSGKWESSLYTNMFSLCLSLIVYNSLAVQLHFKNTAFFVRCIPHTK